MVQYLWNEPKTKIVPGNSRRVTATLRYVWESMFVGPLPNLVMGILGFPRLPWDSKLSDSWPSTNMLWEMIHSSKLLLSTFCNAVVDLCIFKDCMVITLQTRRYSIITIQLHTSTCYMFAHGRLLKQRVGSFTGFIRLHLWMVLFFTHFKGKKRGIFPINIMKIAVWRYAQKCWG